MPRRRKNPREGPAAVILLDKPVGRSSRDVLDDLERRLALPGLGHAGTLDPRASGLLIALTGDARRLQEFFLAGRKTYAARIRFGQISATDDGEGPFRPGPEPVPPLTAAGLEPHLAQFRGSILQVPPAVSAVRVAGVRAHRLARAGTALDLAPRPVTVHRLDLTALGADHVDLIIECGKGLYVRSLARDLGASLGCGAYVETLRRLASGEFTVDDARDPEQVGPADFRPVATILARHPRFDLDRDLAMRLLSGLTVPLDLVPTPDTFAWLGEVPLCQLVTAPGGIRAGIRVASARGGGPPRL